MLCRRISQTTRACCRSSISPNMLVLITQSSHRQFSNFNSLLETKKVQGGNSASSEELRNIRSKKEEAPAVNVADIAERIKAVKASFQKGNILQKQDQLSSRVRTNNAPEYGRRQSSTRNTTVGKINTGGGGYQHHKPTDKDMNNNVNVNPGRGGGNQAPPPSRTRTVQRGRHITQPSADMYDADSDDSDDEEVVTVGQIAHERKLVHLDHKRSEFLRDMPEPFPPKFVKNEEPPAVADPLQKVKAAHSIAEMKAQAAERLAMKIQNPVESTWIDYKAINKEKRHARMNKIKEKNKALKELKWGRKPTENVGTIIYDIKIPHNGLTVRELSQRLSMKIPDTIKRLSDLGELLDPAADGAESFLIDPDVIELLALDLNLDVTRQEAIHRDASEYIKKANRGRADAVLEPRNPIISVMGHVDHGKTTLLDRLREADAAKGEAGGITQKLSAFNVEMDGRAAVFLDTPGHAAFTGMRKSGATGSDLVVLVVAIDDGVRPLTIDAAKVALKSGCTVIVALNKVDKIPEAKEREIARRKALTGLMEVGIIAEEFGGDIQVVEVSGKSGEGVSELVEKLLLQADMMELRASFSGGAEGVVLDAKIEKGRGVMVDLLVKWGTLKVGDAVVVSNAFGKVKAMFDDKGRPIQKAGPSTPIRLLGLNTIPAAGQDIIGVESESKAKKIAERRQRVEDARRIKELNRRAQAIQAATDPIVIPVILKADSSGGLSALRSITDALSERAVDVIVHIIGSSIGDITPGDLALARLVKDGAPATILGFNINNPTNLIRTSAKQNDVMITTNSVIYRLEEALEEVMKSQMPVERISTLEGTANVLQLFSYKMSPSKTRKVAGLDVVSGVLRENSHHYFRVIRGEDIVLSESSGGILKRFKDNVHEVKSGFECGLSLDNFEDIQVGDRIECYKFESIKKELIVHANKKISYAPVKKTTNVVAAEEEEEDS